MALKANRLVRRVHYDGSTDYVNTRFHIYIQPSRDCLIMISDARQLIKVCLASRNPEVLAYPQFGCKYEILSAEESNMLIVMHD